jgi:hypothetical protein
VAVVLVRKTTTLGLERQVQAHSQVEMFLQLHPRLHLVVAVQQESAEIVLGLLLELVQLELLPQLMELFTVPLGRVEPSIVL